MGLPQTVAKSSLVGFSCSIKAARLVRSQPLIYFRL